MLKIFKYLKKTDYLLLLVAAGLVVLQVYLELTIPVYTGKLTTMLSQGSATMSETWKNGGMMILLAFFSLLASVATGFITSLVSASFARNIRKDLFDRILSFSSAEMNRFSTPSLITRTTNDVVNVQNFLAMGIQLLIKAPVTAIWAICKISVGNIRWTVATLIAVVIVVVTVVVIIALCMPRFRRIQKLTDDLNNATRENISGVRVIRAFGAEKHQEEKFENVNREITENNLFTQRVTGLLSPVLTVVMNGLTLAIYWIGADLINDVSGTDPMATLSERATILGDMSVFTQYVMQVIMSFMMLVAIFIILPRVLVCIGRINEVMKTALSIQNGTEKGMDESGTVEFRDVSFGYAKGQEPVLSHVSFKIRKGETLAIIGATGSGKTTLINLIPRFYDADEGEVLVDGTNVKNYDEKDLHGRIALATQKAVMFSGSVRDNITYGSETVDEGKVREALRISCSDFVGELEGGLDHPIAQGGTNVSGGQKQRLSVARAVYKNSEIMIFDDTFSALDYKTDMMVRKNIHESLKDKTVIIIATRIGTIRSADRILVLDNGKVVGTGKHEELLKTCSVYTEIALSQLSKEEL